MDCPQLHAFLPQSPYRSTGIPSSVFSRLCFTLASTTRKCRLFREHPDTLFRDSANHIIRVASITITFVACLLPTIAIIALFKINSRDLVLGLITAFTALFALGLILFSTSSSRQEIFLATIGFSAVVVVFVQRQVVSQ
ncbi:uncharacterized protein K444DRAFT_622146 [Hyaloscypha bicolor E]|uniref:DUF6594 domain-containing protein n=1 Tax=Hyaloscypha bicolor E TaxID=1095630 RepID=A0A2J6SJ36_9HELO|nr:uncharacterized protein K444DRAFT_622146 [Hyaloscypha bicolor E]PMD50782.1 hypothetical protein K444DRAFT_622146 [Hyaloscypha bicolor E]